MTDRLAGVPHEIVGVGFGPANLALAIAVTESPVKLADQAIFFERQATFGWHRGMLIEGATMQVSFLKDLVTMRNPASQFSFLYYLHSRQRLADFINSQTIFPYRIEFHDYFDWAARQLAHLVRYGAEVVAIRPHAEGGLVRLLDVDVRTDDGMATYRTRNVVIGAGLAPRLPQGTATSSRVWHSGELLFRLSELNLGERYSFAVVGAGQSAAEVVSYLHRTYPRADVHAIFSRFGYSVSDDSPFANRIFDPESVDRFYHAPETVKDMLLGYHRNTNYSVVDLDLAKELHHIAYREAVSGVHRLHVHNASRVRNLTQTDTGVELAVEFLPSSTVEQIHADALIFATGYEPADPLSLLGELGAECKRDEQDRLLLGRDYQVITSDAIRCGIYLHGSGAEHTHGLSAGLLSTLSVRAGEITQSIIDHLPAGQRGKENGCSCL
jgi:L-ornithine N5-monooxygenase